MDECCRGLRIPPACPIHPHTVSLCPEAYLPWLAATSDSDSELTGVSHQESMLMFVMKKAPPPTSRLGSLSFLLKSRDSVVCVYLHRWGNVIVFQKCCLKGIKESPRMPWIQMYAWTWRHQECFIWRGKRCRPMVIFSPKPVKYVTPSIIIYVWPSQRKTALLKIC